jgi:2-hydroxycyclohexanecarboxyl-CoA dehydrogenase
MPAVKSDTQLITKELDTIAATTTSAHDLMARVVERLHERMLKYNWVGFYMIERKSGRIVNIASDAGRVGSLGETVYAGAKGGLIVFTKSLARETARHGINVNCVCPGPTDTPLLAAVPEGHLEAFKKAIPLRRFGKPSEVADAVAFFAGPRSTYVTGQVLSVSGGLTMVG